MNNLDNTLDETENTRFGNTYHNLIKQMAKQTQFDEVEVGSILMLYYKFVLINGPRARFMTKEQLFYIFRVLFKIYDIYLIQRILPQISLKSDESKNDVDPIAWVKLFSIFMSNKLEQKMKFVFSVYDVRGVGYLNREVVKHSAEKFFTGEDEDEVNELRTDMVDLIFQKFDLDHDGHITYEEYCNVVTKNPLMLEFLGQCLPTYNGVTVIAYVANIMSKVSELNKQNRMSSHQAADTQKRTF